MCSGMPIPTVAAAAASSWTLAASADVNRRIGRNGWCYRTLTGVTSSTVCASLGRRIMVQLQSTALPLYDRNPAQTSVPSIMGANPSD